MSDGGDNVKQFPGQRPIVVPEQPPDPRIAVMRATVGELIGRANALAQFQAEANRNALLPNPPQLNLGPVIMETNIVLMRAVALLLDERLADGGEPRVTSWTLTPNAVAVQPPGNGKDAS